MNCGSLLRCILCMGLRIFMFATIYSKTLLTRIILPVVLYGCETVVSYTKGGMHAKGV